MVNREKKERRSIVSFNYWEWSIIIILVVFIVLGPIIFTRTSFLPSFVGMGEIGDTIGGITAPFVNLLAAYLVYKSFTAQIRANAQQREDHNEQMAQLNREHNFSYINNLFTVIKNDYYENRRVTSIHYNDTKLVRSHLKYIYSRITSFTHYDDYRYEFKLTGYAQEPDDIYKKISINQSIRESLQTLRHQLINIDMLVDEISTKDFQIGVKNFYMNEIQKMLYDMDLSLILNTNVFKQLQKTQTIFENFNLEAFEKIQGLAAGLNDKGLMVKIPV